MEKKGMARKPKTDGKSSRGRLRAVGSRISTPSKTAAATYGAVWGAAFLASVGVSAAASPNATAPLLLALVPLQLCQVPVLGDVAAWLLPILREGLIYGGAVAGLYGLFFAPAGGKVSPRRLILGGVIMFGVGLMWVSVVTYLGTDVLGGDTALINTATCGMDTGA